MTTHGAHEHRHRVTSRRTLKRRRPSSRARSAPPSSGTTSSSTAPRPRSSSPSCSSRLDAAGGSAAGVRHPVRRLRRPADRRGDLRPLRRPHRPQGHADRDAAADGRSAPCSSAWCRPTSRSASGAPILLTLLRVGAGHRRRRRVGRLGADGDGVGHRASSAGSWRLAAVRACRSACCSGAVVVWRCPGPEFLDLGLARAVPAQHRADRRSASTCGCRSWRARCSPQIEDEGRSRSCRWSRCCKTQWRDVLRAMFVRTAEQAPFYLFTSFVLAYATKTLGCSAATSALRCSRAGLGLVTVPLFGLSLRPLRAAAVYGDGRRGHRPVRVPVLRAARHPRRSAGVARHRARR